LTRAPRCTLPAREKPAAGHRAAEPRTPWLQSHGDPAPSTAVFLRVGWVFFFWIPETEAAPAPWAGAGGTWRATGTGQGAGDRKKEEKPSTRLLDPHRELSSSIPVSPATPFCVGFGADSELRALQAFILALEASGPRQRQASLCPVLLWKERLCHQRCWSVTQSAPGSAAVPDPRASLVSFLGLCPSPEGPFVKDNKVAPQALTGCSPKV